MNTNKNGNGIPNSKQDSNHDGIPNSMNTNKNGDGIPNSEQDSNHDGIPNSMNKNTKELAGIAGLAASRATPGLPNPPDSKVLRKLPGVPMLIENKDFTGNRASASFAYKDEFEIDGESELLFLDFLTEEAKQIKYWRVYGINKEQIKNTIRDFKINPDKFPVSWRADLNNPQNTNIDSDPTNITSDVSKIGKQIEDRKENINKLKNDNSNVGRQILNTYNKDLDNLIAMRDKLKRIQASQ